MPVRTCTGTLFLLTCLLRGMTNDPEAELILIFVSTHMPLARHDSITTSPYTEQIGFLLTCLLRGMTANVYMITWITEFLLTCLLRGMTPLSSAVRYRSTFLLTCLLRGMTLNGSSWKHIHRFLLTCLLRGMTCRRGCTVVTCRSFYSHASCEA